MPSASSPQLYGGPNDSIRIPHQGLADSVRVIHPNPEFPMTTYVRSSAWSAHFGHETFIPAGFPGMPPKQLQDA